MHHKPFLMFKSNPFQEEFQKYEGRSIKTLKIQNFSFFNPFRPSQHSQGNKIYLKKPKIPKNSQSPISNPFQTIRLHKKDHPKLTQKYTIKNSKIKNQKSPKQNFNETKTLALEKLKNKIQSSLIPQKIPETQKSKEIKQLQLGAGEEQNNSDGDSRFFSFNDFSNEKKVEKIQLKQRLYQSIDFDNLFSKIQSQVSQYESGHSPQSSPKMKDKLLLLDKMKRYSKTPNSKARTVFDQFNLKYLINKRKNFNIKNEGYIKGSHLPYFQSFNSYEIKNPSKNEKCYQTNTSLDKTSRRCRESLGQQGESRKKTSSFIVIDDHGIVHEQNPECGDRDQMIKKISGKVINMRQMLKIQKIQPKSSR